MVVFDAHPSGDNMSGTLLVSPGSVRLHTIAKQLLLPLAPRPRVTLQPVTLRHRFITSVLTSRRVEPGPCLNRVTPIEHCVRNALRIQ